MEKQFDAYFKWLGIPPEDQPPNRYRLLGVPLFVDDPAVIDNAADQRMAHLRTFQAGRHAADCQRLLNEVATARVTLLNAEKKAAYDAQLRAERAQRGAGAEAAGKPEPRQRGAPPVGPPPPTPGAQAPAASKPSPAATVEFNMLVRELGEYHLVEKLGEGGMGAVYKAMHTKLGREVAVKVLTTSRLASEKAVARFEREMLAVGRLNHPNIVRAFDAREIEGTRFLVMQLVDGLDLTGVLQHTGPLPVTDACEIVRQAALGLQCAHENQLVHRDIKPGNLMLATTGQVKILDLGLARFEAERAGEEVTSTGTALGTLDYMAPEQASGGHHIDIRADVYSLGCTLYKLLAGRAPFDQPRYAGVMEKVVAHAKHSPPPISRFRGDVPKEVAAILNRMMAKDPARRFQTPGEVADAVGPFCATADLAGLLARAKHSPPQPAPSRALENTQGRLSNSLTNFLQVMMPGRPAVRPAPHMQPKGRRIALGAAAAVTVAVLAVALVWAVRRPGPAEAPPAVASVTEGDGVPKRAALVLRLSEAERTSTEAWLNNARVALPSEEPWEIASRPGAYHVRLTRTGFEPYQESIRLAPGQEVSLKPEWVPETALVLVWPADQRQDARLHVDGHRVPLPAAPDEPEELRIPSPAGVRQVWAERRGYLPFNAMVNLGRGEQRRLAVQWKAIGSPPSPEHAAAIPPSELPESPPQPMEDEDPATQPALEEITPPSAERQKRLIGALNEVYRTAEAVDPASRAALARKLLADGRKRQGSRAEQFVMLRRASELARDAGDVELMLESVDAIAGAGFSIPAWRTKGLMLKAMISQADRDDPKALCAVVDSCIAAAHQAVADAAFDEASNALEAARLALSQAGSHWQTEYRTARLALSRARTPADQAERQRRVQEAEVTTTLLEDTLAAVTECAQAVAQAQRDYEAVRLARRRLETSPDDADARAVVGRWLCFQRGDWDEGLRLLAAGSDDALRALAMEELNSEPSAVEVRVARGDRWWELAEKSEGRAQIAMRSRAGLWYADALPELSGLVQKRIEARLAQVEAEPAPQEQTDRIRPGRWTGVLERVRLPDHVGGRGNPNDWRLVDGTLSASGADGSWVAIPVAPSGDYEFQVKLIRRSPPDLILIMLPVGPRRATFELDGWPRRGGRSGFSKIAGQRVDSDRSPSSVHGIHLPEGMEHTVLVRVETKGDMARLSATANGEPVASWAGPIALLDSEGVLGTPALEDMPVIGLSKWACRVDFVDARIRMLNGTAHLVDSASLQALDKSAAPAGEGESRERPPLQKLRVGKWVSLFSSPKELSGWNTENADFAYLNGLLELRSSSIHFRSEASDFAFRARVKKLSGQNLSLYFRHSTDGHYGAWYNGGNWFGLGKAVDGRWRDIQQVRTPGNHDKGFEFAVSAIGDKIEMFVNGQRILAVTDDSHASGEVGLGANRGNSLFTDVAIQVLKE